MCYYIEGIGKLIDLIKASGLVNSIGVLKY